jgi:hypothetical protein
MNDPQDRILWNNEWLTLDRHVIEQNRNRGVNDFLDLIRGKKDGK